MKIGILTYHRAENYGAELQAVALRQYLTKQGAKVSFIDYYPDYHKKIYKLPVIPWKKIIRHPFRHKFFIKEYIYKYFRKRSFSKFQKKHINPYCAKKSDEFDAIIYGSDQIWRKQPILNDYNPIYFGFHHIKTKKHFSYAASTDSPPQNNEDKIRFKKLLKGLDTISVRETTLLNSIKELGYDSVVSLDPAFLLSKEEWIKTLNLKKKDEEKYVLVYDLHEIFDYQAILNNAKENHLKVKRLIGKANLQLKDTAYITAGPTDFVEMVMNAECVITNSFHGLVFSLIFQKPVFATSLPQIEDRIFSLLNLIKHPKLYKPLNEISSCIPKDIDYDDINKGIDIVKEASYQYLYNITKNN